MFAFSFAAGSGSEYRTESADTTAVTAAPGSLMSAFWGEELEVSVGEERLTSFARRSSVGCAVRTLNDPRAEKEGPRNFKFQLG